jgi:hypothetical protein
MIKIHFLGPWKFCAQLQAILFKKEAKSLKIAKKLLASVQKIPKLNKLNIFIEKVLIWIYTMVFAK